MATKKKQPAKKAPAKAAPAKAVQEHRRGAPRARYTRTDPQTGAPVHLVTNADGVVAIRTDQERRAADRWGLRRTSLPRASTKDVQELQVKKEAD